MSFKLPAGQRLLKGPIDPKVLVELIIGGAVVVFDPGPPENVHIWLCARDVPGLLQHIRNELVVDDLIGGRRVLDYDRLHPIVDRLDDRLDTSRAGINMARISPGKAP